MLIRIPSSFNMEMYNLGSAFWCQVIALLSCFCSSWHKELSGLAPCRAMSKRAIVQRSAVRLLHPQLLRSAFIDGDGGSQASGWEQGGEARDGGLGNEPSRPSKHVHSFATDALQSPLLLPLIENLYPISDHKLAALACSSCVSKPAE